VTVPAGAPPPLGLGPHAGPQSPILHVSVIAVADHCPPSGASSAARALSLEAKSTIATSDAATSFPAKTRIEPMPSYHFPALTREFAGW
jgi:hypothetical protein